MLTPLRFGCFLAPWHRPGEDPNLLLRRDLRITELVDELNFDEMWIGEHHTGGWGTVTAPELFIAAAAERTKRIKLATGVTALPYHHPYMVAERAMQLDNLTRGRFILGVGAGSGAADMHMLGVAPEDTRRRVEESMDTILPLLRGETVTRKTDWFTLVDGRVQLRPFNPGGFEIAITSASTPFGMRLAGRTGIGVLSNASAPWGAARAGHSVGVERLAEQWRHLQDTASATGTPCDRKNWRLVVPVHVAESREQAIADILPGWLRDRGELWADTMGFPVARGETSARKAFETTVAAGGILVGDVDDVVAGIEKLQEATGGFGTLLITLQDWTTPERSHHSLELFARFVAPRFRGSAHGLLASQSWVASNRVAFQEAQFAARSKAMTNSGE
ncbi:LLM class flavin-dependent oxidoreductase [Streptomyces sp. NPDC018833]|uniref:LLM class flavin-dependent oxidoreductase n=1 Tax=Streptomyces sp. NPDC018833 TaxID=3365053 RepID=UPI003799238F